MKITFTGDILIYESQDIGCLSKDGKRDYRPIFEQVKPLLDQSDYVVGSFETTTSGEKAGYTHASTSFNTPDELLPALKWAGFDLLTTANNHCFDRGEAGLRRTIGKIAENGLEHTGTRLSDEDPIFLIKDFKGTKVAFLAYTYGTNSRSNGCIITKDKEYLVNLTRPQDEIPYRPLLRRAAGKLLSIVRRPKVTSGVVGDCVCETEVNSSRNTEYENKMLNTIRNAKQRADIVIMCLHSGGQFNSKVEGYTQHLFDIIADAGADAIVCNHAHTTLPIYRRGNCLIASALGNFSFAPGEGYWVDGVNAEYSALLSFNIVNKRIVDYCVNICKCARNKEGLAVTVPVSNVKEIATINNRLNNISK